MRTIIRTASSTMLVLGAVLCILISSSDAAEWTVTKVSGAVWFASSGVQKVSLGASSKLDDGDQVTTGANGRVMLSRGEETILVSPNSVISLPQSASPGLSTTILQQAGSILLSVEKRNVNHFEVRTPFLAAIVKGTRFVVTVSPKGATVDVTEGRVEVADFGSGQVTLVLPGQTAQVSSDRQSGLHLGGSGKLEPVRQGSPQSPGLDVLKVPSGGFSGPVGKALGRSASIGSDGLAAKAVTGLQKTISKVQAKAAIDGTRETAAKATNGLAKSKFGFDSKKNLGSFWNYDVASSIPGVGNAPGVEVNSGQSSGNAAGGLGNVLGGVGGAAEGLGGGLGGLGGGLGGLGGGALGGVGGALGGVGGALGDLGGGVGGGLGGLPGGLGGIVPGLGG